MKKGSSITIAVLIGLVIGLLLAGNGGEVIGQGNRSPQSFAQHFKS